MAPAETKAPPLGRYELYKAGTKKVVDWLTQTADRCIDIVPLISSGPKSKNKINARALVSLAEAIVAAHQPPASPSAAIAVTPTIISLLREVIDGRQASADWYFTQPASDELADANLTHAFFIDILREVHKLLLSVQQPSKIESGPKRAKSKKKACLSLEDNFNNLFLQLELEEPSEDPLGTVPKHSERPEPRQPIKSIALDEDSENVAFSLWCHLEDLRSIRLFAREIWVEYAAGQVSALTASMITEAAFGMMRISNEKFVSAHGTFKDWWSLPKFLSLRVLHASGNTYLYPMEDITGRTTTKARSDLVELITPPAMFVLQDVADAVNDRISSNDDNPAMTTLLHNDNFDFGAVLLTTANLDEIVAHVRDTRADGRSPRFSGMDEFMAGLVNFIITGDAPIWLVCGCQLYCDVLQLIGSDLSCVSGAYLDEVTRMEFEVDCFLKYFKTSKPRESVNMDNCFAGAIRAFEIKKTFEMYLRMNPDPTDRDEARRLLVGKPTHTVVAFW